MQASPAPCTTLQPAKLPLLFGLCWAVYFTVYLGRCNYGALLAEIIVAEGYSSSVCGLVGTGFFICYGLGQLLSGALGDKIHPRKMVFVGVFVSGIANLGMGIAQSVTQMVIIWCLNGCAQSLIWSPIIRVIAEYFPMATRKNACLNIATTYPVGVLTTYVLAAALIGFGNWRLDFFATGALMMITAVVWLIGFGALERFRTVPDPYAQQTGTNDALPPKALLRLPHLLPALVFICIALTLHGALRDGVTTWTPTYFTSIFKANTFVSVLCTTLLPVLSFVGAKGSGVVAQKMGWSEVTAGFVLFGCATAVSCITLTLLRNSFIGTLVSFSVLTALMMGVNVLMVSIIPTYFAKWGRVSLVSGIVNAFSYIGSSLSTFGFGALAQSFGWQVLPLILLAASILGMLCCAVGQRFWKQFFAATQHATTNHTTVV